MAKSILIVSGSTAMNYLLQTVLKKEYEIISVSDVFQAMQHLRKNKSIKTILIDLDFQMQHGWELIEHIKSSRLFKLPVIVLSTDNNDTLKKKCYDFEVDEIFIKPFNPLDLIAAIKMIMPEKESLVNS
ncbi:MAG: response regulator [Flavisolibacter sp.]